MPWKRIGWPPLVTFVNGQVLKIIIYPSVHTALDIQVSNVTTHAVRKVILQYEWLAIYYLWYLNFFYLSLDDVPRILEGLIAAEQKRILE